MSTKIFITVLFSLMLIYGAAFSQSVDVKPEWKLYKEISGLQIYSSDLSCNDNQNGIHNQFICFQFINTSSETMNISWQFELWYNDKCITCDKPANSENSYILTVKPGESIEGNCDKKSIAGLKIFTGIINSAKGSKLSKFEFKNLEVTFK
ncbi:MAG: hypothetical protein HY951_13070 [Bacteroidia bacterium]|nr:hypothetical protein [Bacteroidia bacterium]